MKKTMVTIFVTVLFAFSANAVVIIDSFTEGVGPGGGGNKTIQTSFDASGSDKLVIVLGGEHGFSGNTGGNFNSVSYGGTALVPIIQEGSSYPTVAGFYLDNPGAAGDIVVNQANHNGSPYGIYLLSGTQAGVGSAATDTDTSVDLTTTAVDSLVIAAIDNSGPDGGNGAPNMTAVAPLVEDSTDLVAGGGRRWNSFSSAHQFVAAPGLTTNAFSGENQADVVAIAAMEFLAEIPEPASLVFAAFGGLFIITRRR